jgi:predicted DNA-binding transcriptional regulator AlpA
MTDETSDKPILDFSKLDNSALLRPGFLHEHQIVPFSPATRRRKVEDRTFPPPIKISSNIVAFRVGDIRCWQNDPANYKAADHHKFRSNERRESDIDQLIEEVCHEEC